MRERLLIGLVVVAAFALGACGGAGQAPSGGGNRQGGGEEKKDPIVEVLPVTRANISRAERSTGRIEARDTADVFARVSEVALSVLHDVGDKVNKGDKLAVLDSRQSQIEFNTAELDLKDAEVALRKAQFEETKARADLDRMMSKSEVFTKEAIDNAKLNHDRAVIGVETARLTVTRKTEAFERARINLEQTTIVAPISGIITERSIRANELVATNARVFRIADFSVLEVKLDVPEASLKDLHSPATGPDGVSRLDAKTQAALIGVTAYPLDRFLGYLDRISPVVDTQRGMVVATVRVIPAEEVDEKAHAALLAQFDAMSRDSVLKTAAAAKAGGSGRRALRPGMWADSRIALEVREKVLTVPGAALVGDSEEIWLVRELSGEMYASRLSVAGRRGVSSEGVFELLEAKDPAARIKPGELVVVRGQGLLRENQKVRVVDLSRR